MSSLLIDISIYPLLTRLPWMARAFATCRDLARLQTEVKICWDFDGKKALGFRIEGLGFRAQGSGLRV